jgi:hypothetical protein
MEIINCKIWRACEREFLPWHQYSSVVCSPELGSYRCLYITLPVSVHNITKNSVGKSTGYAGRVHVCTFPDTHVFGVPFLELRGIQENVLKVISLQW